MKKFECNNCVIRKCITYYDKYSSVNRPSRCTAGSEYIANWHEVKEDSEENTQTTVKSEQLPDWVKVGEWVYSTVYKEYVQISDIDEFDVSFNSGAYCSVGHKAFLEDYVPARKRPFNEKEMRELVGKVLETSHVALLVDAYMKVTKNIVTSCGIYTAEELRDRFTVDGKPCYKLEHLNEKGEWVE